MAYARQLRVSPNHLNAMLKQEMGFSVSYRICHATILEAKRLLVYSTLNMRQVAAVLGCACCIFARKVRPIGEIGQFSGHWAALCNL